MKECKVCKQQLPDEKFNITRHTLKGEIVKEYRDSTCMVCRRKKHLENPKKREVHRKGSKNWYQKNPEKAKSQRLKRYGITYEQYNELREKQNYCCASCGRHESVVEQGRAKGAETALCVDHCHSTGKVRGLLCTNCNTLIGKAKDDIETLNKAIQYLKEHHE